jgi:hypothetical protein
MTFEDKTFYGSAVHDGDNTRLVEKQVPTGETWYIESIAIMVENKVSSNGSNLYFQAGVRDTTTTEVDPIFGERSMEVYDDVGDVNSISINEYIKSPLSVYINESGDPGTWDILYLILARRVE